MLKKDVTDGDKINITKTRRNTVCMTEEECGVKIIKTVCSLSSLLVSIM